MGVKIKVRGNSLTLDTGVRDVPHRRVSKIKPFRDRGREADAGYVFSLPAPSGDGKYFGRDAAGSSGRQMEIFLGKSEEDEDAEAIEPALEPGNYHSVSSFDGVHIYRDEGEEQQQLSIPENAGMRIGDDLPERLRRQNATNRDFWRKLASGDKPAPLNAAAIGKAIAAARNDPGTRDGAMLGQRANHAVNELHRAFYAGCGQQDRHEAPRPKGFATPAQINAANKARWSRAGRQ